MKRIAIISWGILVALGVWMTIYAESIGRIPDANTPIIVYYLIVIGLATLLSLSGYIGIWLEKKSRRFDKYFK